MRKLTKTGVKINTRIARAIARYGLIDEGDRILVGVSGGKDSLSLLYILRQIQTWSPVKFELKAFHLQKDFKCGNAVNGEMLKRMFDEMDVPHEIRQFKLEEGKKGLNCFWCSWNRRRILFEEANQGGFNKIALGHHKDDIVETVLINLLWRGNISTMNPIQPLFEGKFKVIRPLCYVEESMMSLFAREMGFPMEHHPCMGEEDSRRKYVKRFIAQTQANTPSVNVRTNIFRSLSRIREDYIDLKG